MVPVVQIFLCLLFHLGYNLGSQTTGAAQDKDDCKWPPYIGFLDQWNSYFFSSEILPFDVIIVEDGNSLG